MSTPPPVSPRIDALSDQICHCGEPFSTHGSEHAPVEMKDYSPPEKPKPVTALAMSLAKEINHVHANSLWSRTRNPDRVIAELIEARLPRQAAPSLPSGEAGSEDKALEMAKKCVLYAEKFPRYVAVGLISAVIESQQPATPPEAHADSLRLDWLEKSFYILMPDEPGEGPWVCGKSTDFSPGFKGKTAREAIDAAIAAQPPALLPHQEGR